MKDEKAPLFKVEKLGERITPGSTGFYPPDIGRTRSATNFLRPALCALGLVVGFTVGGAARPAGAQPRYTVHDLGTLGGGSFVGAKRINNIGQVVGTYATGSAIHGFRTAPNSPLNAATDDIGVDPSCYSSATGINDLGQVTGFFTWGSPCPSTPGPDLAYANRHAFRTAPNSAVIPASDVIVAGGSLYGEIGTAINLSGQTALFTVLGDGPKAALAYRSTPNGVPVVTTYLGTLDPVPGPSLADSYAYDINDIGQVVGSSSVVPGGPHAFRTAPNSPINPATDNLGTLGGSFSYALGINSSGQVAGFSYPANDTAYRAFRTAPNSPINPAADGLGTLSGFFSSFANGINRSGQVVGCSDPTFPYGCTASSHAFLYTSSVMYDLNGLIPANSGWTLQDASSINDLGQIVGKGVVNGATHAFRLDPADPASFASLISSLIDTLKSLNLPPGLRKNLIASLQASLDAVARGNTALARNQLKAFINQVNAQIGKNLTTTQANTLLNLAAQAMQMLS